MRLLEALPAAAASALMHHHIDASSQQHQQLAATLAAERAVSVAQVKASSSYASCTALVGGARPCIF